MTIKKTLARREHDTREAERTRFQKEFIHQYKLNRRVPKSMRMLVSVHLACISCADIKDLDAYSLTRTHKDIKAYVHDALGFKDESEIFDFACDAWRNRLALESW